ncbi:MAG TPA: glycosyltransferase [Planctomycetaceae bacterium]|jgi:GT2 family glycosyltransferase
MKEGRRQFRVSDVAIAIPTYGRDQVLLETIQGCLHLDKPAGDILVIDQTPEHDLPTERALQTLHNDQRIRWVRLAQPSIPRAMNRALQSTERSLVLYLDDDIIPTASLVQRHVEAHNEFDPWVVVGQIIQPWQEPCDVSPPAAPSPLWVDFDFPFHTTQSCWLQNAMAGNMSVRRDRTIQIGGFDENFRGVAFRFETEFARRVIRHGGRIRFCPTAGIRHLRVARGGTRLYGNHLTSADPNHGVGDYYFAMSAGWTAESVRYMWRRMAREIATKFHLRHPWYIPVKLVGEMRACCWAFRLQRGGPALLPHASEGAAAATTNVCDVCDKPLIAESK